MIKCVVTVQGLLDRCSVASETPVGVGFGPAALLLAPVILMKPRTVDGQAVGGAEVTIPISFLYPSGDPKHDMINGTTIYQMAEAFWLKAPTAASVVDHFPVAAKGKTPKGHVVLHCAFAKDGALQHCDVLQEEPKGVGFGRAALALSKEFQADVSAYKDKLGFTHIDVPVHFLDPAGPEWQHRTLAQPHWTAVPSFDDVQAAFPAKAKVANIFTGTGNLDCLTLPGGKLGDCHIVNELPGNLGFGVAALQLAPTMAMNPWTVEGLPSDGVRIRLPMKMLIDAPTPATKP